jgi:hypothetical protein
MSNGPADRRSPWLRNVLLLGAFVLIVVAAIFTVVLPELSDEPEEQQTPVPAAE